MPRRSTPGEGTIRLDAARLRTLRRRILRWWRSEARTYPWRAPGRSPYEILIAEVLLKRTTATAAARVYEDVLNRYPSVADLHRARERSLERLLSSVGLQRQRARSLKEIARYLIQVEHGEVPTTAKRLGQIPHIGPYTVAAVMSFGANRPAAVVDSNVDRILRRVFEPVSAQRHNDALIAELAAALLPRSRHREFNLALLDFGALICRYGNPRCAECPIAYTCDYARRTPPSRADTRRASGRSQSSLRPTPCRH